MGAVIDVLAAKQATGGARRLGGEGRRKLVHLRTVIPWVESTSSSKGSPSSRQRQSWVLPTLPLPKTISLASRIQLDTCRKISQIAPAADGYGSGLCDKKKMSAGAPPRVLSSRYSSAKTDISNKASANLTIRHPQQRRRCRDLTLASGERSERACSSSSNGDRCVVSLVSGVRSGDLGARAVKIV